MSHSSRPSSTRAVAALLAGLALVAAGCGDDSSDVANATTTPTINVKPTTVELPKGDRAVVVRAIDGDTLDVKMEDGKKVRVRLLGIDAPESTTKRNGHVECGAKYATGAITGLTTGNTNVVLVDDPTQDKTDQYGRRLAYVYAQSGRGRTLQEQLLTVGWVAVYEQRGTPIKLDREFRTAAAKAKHNGAGVWQICGGDFHRAE